MTTPTALELHIPVPMIRMYESTALRKLRHPSRSSKLEQLLSDSEGNTMEIKFRTERIDDELDLDEFCFDENAALGEPARNACIG